MRLYVVYVVFVVSIVLVCGSPSTQLETILGKKISLQDLKTLLPTVTAKVFPELLFEHDGQGHLVAYGRNLEIGVLAPNRNFVKKSSPSLSTPVKGNSHAYQAIQWGNEYSFSFDSRTRELISGHGPGIRLVPVDSVRYPGVFLNTFDTRKRIDQHLTNTASAGILPSTGKMDSQLLRGSKVSEKGLYVVHQKRDRGLKRRRKLSCTGVDVPTLEIAVAYDSAFCAKHSGSHNEATNVVRDLLLKIEEEFQRKVCVQIRAVSVDSYCNPEYDPFKISRAISKCKKERGCNVAEAFLRNLKKAWQGTVSVNAHRDAIFFFSGYESDSSETSASFKSAACDEDFSYAWTSSSLTTVVAHQIGHMLGAPHDSRGIMRSVVNPKDVFQLSNNSAFYINRFLEMDPRSWCLRRERMIFPRLQAKYFWNSPRPILTTTDDDPIFSDISFAGLSRNGTSSLLLLSSKSRSLETTLSLSTIGNMDCTVDGLCSYDIPSELIDIGRKYSVHSIRFSLASGHIKSATSNDIIISHIKPSKRRFKQFYQIGYGISSSSIVPKMWSEEIEIRAWTAKDVQSSGITMGGIRSEKSNDLILAHVENQRGANVAYYQIGFDMGPKGNVRGKWSKSFQVQGWYGKETTGMSVALYDIDANGKPDLVMFHMDNSSTIQSGFYRVGRDLNHEGVVTGGWSDYVRVPKLLDVPARLSGMMAIAPSSSGAPIMAVIQRDSVLFAEQWQLYVSSKAVTREVLDTSSPVSVRDNISGGCSTCYDGDEADRCLKYIDLCHSAIDEVTVSKEKWKKSSGAISTTKLRRRSVASPGNSLFCSGFHYLYTNNVLCNVFDSEVVVSKGVEQAFLKNINEVQPIRISDYNSTTLLEGSRLGEQVASGDVYAARINIYGKNLQRSEILSTAAKKLRKASDWSSAFEKRFVRIKKRSDHYTVTFRFKKNYIQSN